MADGKTIGTMGLVLAQFLDQVTEAYPNINFVHDEQLTLESALTKLRAKWDKNPPKSREEFPLFAFNRSALHWSENGMGRRSVTNRAFNRPTKRTSPPPSVTIRKAAQAVFDINFLLIGNPAEEQEIFEVDYLGENAFTNIKQVTVSLPDIGDFPYYITYSQLLTKSMSSNNIYYKTVSGSASFLGWYFSLVGSGKVITDIEFKIKLFTQTVIGSTSLLAPT